MVKVVCVTGRMTNEWEYFGRKTAITISTYSRLSNKYIVYQINKSRGKFHEIDKLSPFSQ